MTDRDFKWWVLNGVLLAIGWAIILCGKSMSVFETILVSICFTFVLVLLGVSALGRKKRRRKR